MVKKSWLYVLILLVFLCAKADAITLKFNGFIADEANLLSPEVENDLNMTLWDLQKKSGADLVVVTLPSLDGKTVEEVAIDIGRSYKLGAVGKNNGMVYLTALNERRMRIEQGLGLEDKIPVSTLENIMNGDILPYYKQNDYETGIRRGTYMLAQTVAQAEGVKISIQGIIPDSVKSNYSDRRNKSFCSTCKRGEFCSYHRGRYNCYPWWLYPLAFILAIFSPRRKRFNSGSFGGFGGGGGFGGSGCSGSW